MSFRALRLLVGTAALVAFLLFSPYSRPSFTGWTVLRHRRSPLLPIPSTTYVINLLRRSDRRQDMERLRARLGVDWIYAKAEDSDSALVTKIESQVRSLRKDALEKHGGFAGNKIVSLPLRWPDPNSPVSSTPFQDLELPTPLSDNDTEPLVNALGEFDLRPYSPELNAYQIMGRGSIACWHSHLSIIYTTARQGGLPSLILEDDVDVEEDVKDQLRSVWPFLPADWDIIFLGHCWSNESYYPALGPPTTNDSHTVRLHPSYAPLCTHAYALSPAGARRLLHYLTHPPFAYSRPIDQAFKWFIQNGHIKGFSVVPVLVAQRKIDASDVMKGKKNPWKDHLVHGVLNSEEGSAEFADV